MLDGEDLHQTVDGMMEQVVHEKVHSAFAETGYLESREQLDSILAQFEGVYFAKGACSVSDQQLNGPDGRRAVQTDSRADAPDLREEKSSSIPNLSCGNWSGVVLLRVVDEYWMDHIDAMADFAPGHWPAVLWPVQCSRRI